MNDPSDRTPLPPPPPPEDVLSGPQYNSFDPFIFKILSVALDAGIDNVANVPPRVPTNRSLLDALLNVLPVPPRDVLSVPVLTLLALIVVNLEPSVPQEASVPSLRKNIPDSVPIESFASELFAFEYMISPRVYDVCPVPPLLYGTVPNLSLLSVPVLTLLALSDDNPDPLPVCVPEK